VDYASIRRRFGIIAFGAAAEQIDEAKIVLCRDVAILGCFLPPADRCLGIVLDATSIVIEHAEIELRARIALRRKISPDLERGRKVTRLVSAPSVVEVGGMRGLNAER